MEKEKKNKPEHYNGVVVGAAIILASLIWFAIPLLSTGRVMFYPGISFAIGIITVLRHLNFKR